LGLFCCDNKKTNAPEPIKEKEAVTVSASAPKEAVTGLLTVQEAQARMSAASKTLSLNDFTALDLEAARALATFTGKYIDLNGLTSLEASIAKELAAFNGVYLSLNGLTSLDANTAKELAALNGGSLSDWVEVCK
jgi:hypothetical protein